MGPLELAVFQREQPKWKALRRQLMDSAEVSTDRASSASTRVFRKDVTDDQPSANLDGAQGVATQLMLAKAIDAHDGLADSIGGGAPVVVFDVADPFVLRLMQRSWKGVVFGDAKAPSAPVDSEVRTRGRDSFGSLHLFVLESETASNRDKRREAALAAMALARPLLAFSPMCATHLPDVVVRACETRLSVGPPDADTVAKTIRIVTGERPRAMIEPSLLARIGVEEIAVAVRFDRTAQECMDRLKQLALQGLASADSRELRLDDLHGMDEAVAWARSFVRDVGAWRRGQLEWNAIEAGVVFEGPSGTGKTTLAKVISAESGLNLTVASLGKWQGSRNFTEASFSSQETPALQRFCAHRHGPGTSDQPVPARRLTGYRAPNKPFLAIHCKVHNPDG
jgi:cell division protease FtsH